MYISSYSQYILMISHANLMATLQSFFILYLQNHTFSDMRQSWMVLSEIEPVISWNNKKEETKEQSQVQSNCHILPWWCRVSHNYPSNSPRQFSNMWPWIQGPENLDHSTGKVLNKKTTTIGTVLLGRRGPQKGGFSRFTGLCLKSFEVTWSSTNGLRWFICCFFKLRKQIYHDLSSIMPKVN